MDHASRLLAGLSWRGDPPDRIHVVLWEPSVCSVSIVRCQERSPLVVPNWHETYSPIWRGDRVGGGVRPMNLLR